MTIPLRKRSPHAHLPVGSADVLPRLAAAAWPDRVALRAGDRTVTFAGLDRDISRLAFGLRQWLGGDGLPVVVSAVLGVGFPVALHAVLRSGNVAAPVNPRMPAATFARAARHRPAVRRRARAGDVRTGPSRCSPGMPASSRWCCSTRPPPAGSPAPSSRAAVACSSNRATATSTSRPC